MHFEQPQVIDFTDVIMTFVVRGSGDDVKLHDLTGQWTVSFDGYSRQWLARLNVIDTTYQHDDLPQLLDALRESSGCRTYYVKSDSDN